MQSINIETIDGGAVIERINYQISRVVDDIQDLNTAPEAIREVTVKLKFKPSSDRADAIISIEANAKLAAMKPRTVQVGLSGINPAEFAQQESIRFEKN